MTRLTMRNLVKEMAFKPELGVRQNDQNNRQNGKRMFQTSSNKGLKIG